MFKKDRETKEFFEVFKQPKELKDPKYSSRRFQSSQVTSIFPKQGITRKKEVVSGGDEKSPLNWIKDTTSEEHSELETQSPGKAFLKTITIRPETLILVALGAAFLSAACYFTGYKLGYNKALNPEIIQKSAAAQELNGDIKSIPPGKEIGAVDLVEKSLNEDPNVKWTLQIITYSNTKKNIKKAGNLAKAIKNMTGYNTFVAKRGKELVVCAGRFGSKNSPEAKKALREISNLEYEGKKQFKSSYPIQIK